MCRTVNGQVTAVDSKHQDLINGKLWDGSPDKGSMKNQYKFYHEGILNIKNANIQSEIEAQKAEILFTIITPNGKHVELDNNYLLFLQKNANGHGKTSIVHGGEVVVIDVPQVLNCINGGLKFLNLAKFKTKLPNKS